MPEVPESLKTHNWTLYEYAMSADPSISCQYVGKLVTSLQITMNIADIHEFDEMLQHETLGARRAWKEYNDGMVGRAMQTVMVVITNIGILLYDKRFATTQAKAFTGR